MRSIEESTTRRRPRRWHTHLPRWTTTAAAVLIGFIGSQAVIEFLLQRSTD